jgi:hypothetical protein
MRFKLFYFNSIDTFVTETLIWNLVIGLSIFILLLILFLIILRNRIRIKERKYAIYEKKTEQILIEYLYSVNEGIELVDDKKRKKLKSDLLNRRKRKVITSIFLKLRQEVSGGLIINMGDIYKRIGLDKYDIIKLNSNKWNSIALGIRDLRFFKIKGTQNSVSKFINHPREEVRREAHLYFIGVLGFKGLDFLDNLTRPLSEWDQIQLLGLLKKFDDQEMPDIKRWLKSNNDYVILFTLNIIYNFNRIETKEDLLLLLNHSNEIIRIKTIEIFSKFEFEEAKNILKENYTNLSINEKYAFWNYLKKIATLEDTSFILKHLKDADFEVKHIALEILFAINKEEFNLLEHNSNDETLNKIIHFINHNYGY